MYRKIIIGLGIVALIILVITWVSGFYNGLVNSRERVNAKWANVEAQYQRRSDLIPNLVSTVKGAADFEKSTLEAVMSARASATQIKIDADNLTPEKLQQFQQAQGQVSSALGRLLAVAENYPQLRAVQNFSELQAQLEGTENRINEARRQFIEAVQTYNASIKRFPGMIVANLTGFKEKPNFQADAGAEKASKVTFPK
ncbi:MAG: LemA family protein [Bacteroidetes bacterium]|nr:LemA family protein [Bacteroidota bacterium]